MRIKIEAESQEEVDQKRPDLIKALAGSTFEVVVKPKARSRYDSEKSATTPRQPVFQAQREIFEQWDAKFKAMLEDLKREVGEIIG